MKNQIPYNTLAITLFSKCTASCEMCCFSCTPKSKEKLDKNKIIQLINESEGMEWIKTISFSGGEAFLEYKNLCEFVEYASKAKKKVTIITNGYWAISYEKTLEKLKILKSKGLNKLSVSYDEFHQKFIDLNNIKNLLDVSKILSLPITLGMVKTKRTKEGEIIDKLGESIINVPTYIYPCLPSGEAKKTIRDNEFIRKKNIKDLGKCPHGGIISVFFDNKIYPCCSQSVVNTDLSIGNLNDDSIEKIISNVKTHGILFILRNFGFQWFIDIGKKELNMDFKEYYVNECELCAEIFSKDKINLFYPFIKEFIKEMSN